MRTDSINISDFAIQAAEAEITKKYGQEYANPTHYVTKKK